MWLHFDSGFYTDIARHGYWGASTLHDRSNWAFFPLYPWIISCVRWLFGSGEDAYIIAGVLISNIASVIAMGYLYALVFREFGKRAAGLTVLYLALFPMSFYLSAVYPEALFLTFAIASIYYARRQSWFLASLLGGLAALTRAQGVLLIVPIGWEYLRVTAERYESLPQLHVSSLRTALNSSGIWFVVRVRGLWRATHSMKNWRNALLLLLIPAGLFVFMLYGQLATGDLLATFHTQDWGWHRRFTFFGRLLIYSLRNPIINQPLNWNFWLLNIILAFVFLGFVLLAFFRLPSIYALYTLVMVLLPLSSNFLNSFDRYCLLIFPAFLLIALYTQEKRPALRHFLIGGFAALQAILMLFFVVGLPAIA
jgi:4-amino-4-deoxy-L-arabinose transferase-like glycosyltransferase